MSTFRIPGLDETFDLVSKPTFAEARAIEKVTGHNFEAIQRDKGLRGSATTTQAILWVSMKRTIPTTLFSDLDDIQMEAIEFDETPDPTQPPKRGRQGSKGAGSTT